MGMRNIEAVIVMTHTEKSGLALLPHLPALIASNPDVSLHLCIGLSGNRKLNAWRNCDRTLRDCWRHSRHKIAGAAIAVIEWDVLVTQKLPPLSGDFQAKQIVKQGEIEWHWWTEAHLLNGIPAYGAAPIGVSFWSREALDYVADPRWDDLYRRDIFCELRTPSILATKFQMLPMDLPDVDWKDCQVSPTPGISHPVKAA